MLLLWDTKLVQHMQIWQNSAMNPSGSGLFFFGRFFTALSISLLALDMFKWLISSWFNYEWLYVSRNLSISFRFLNLFEYRFSKYSLDFLDFLGFCCYLPFFISNFINVESFPTSLYSDFPRNYQSYLSFQITSFLFYLFVVSSFYQYFVDFEHYFYYFFPSACFEFILFLFF
jgi:hypothetical protein